MQGSEEAAPDSTTMGPKERITKDCRVNNQGNLKGNMD
jgi:hypothetical protein